MNVFRKETSSCHGFETWTYLETHFCHSVRWQDKCTIRTHQRVGLCHGDTDIWSDGSDQKDRCDLIDFVILDHQRLKYTEAQSVCLWACRIYTLQAHRQKESDWLLADKLDMSLMPQCNGNGNGCQRRLTLGVPSLSSMVTPVQSSPISMKHRRYSLGLSQEGQTRSDAASQGRRSVNRWSRVCAVAAELRLSPSGSSSTAQCTSLHPTAPTLEPAPSSKPPNLNRATRLRRLKA